MKNSTNRLVVARSDLPDTIPAWLRAEILDERWISLLRSLSRPQSPKEQIGDAETLAYLITLSHRTALPSGHVRIFAHLVYQVLGRRRPDMPSLRPLPVSHRLTELEQQELMLIKSELYEARGDIELPLSQIA